MTRAQGTTLWLALNVCGALVYVYFASWVWPPPELRGMAEGHAAGDPIIWGLSALPTALVCVVVDLGVLAWGAWGGVRGDLWPFRWWAWCIPALWVLAYLIDRYHE